MAVLSVGFHGIFRRAREWGLTQQMLTSVCAGQRKPTAVPACISRIRDMLNMRVGAVFQHVVQCLARWLDTEEAGQFDPGTSQLCHCFVSLRSSAQGIIGYQFAS